MQVHSAKFERGDHDVIAQYDLLCYTQKILHLHWLPNLVVVLIISSVLVPRKTLLSLHFNKV